MNKLLQRAITALVLVGILLVVFFALPPAAALGLLGAFVVAASWEWAGFLLLGSTWRWIYAAMMAVLLLLSARWIPDLVSLRSVLVMALLWWLCAALLVARFPVSLPRALTAVCGVLVLLPAWTGLLGMLRDPQAGPAMVLYLLAIVWSADMGAYFVGRRWGRVKLAPRISPGKTWEGVAGGVLAAGIAAAAGAAWIGFPPAIMVPVGLSVAAISILGDLTVSLFKRNAGLKDSGQLFPGHGGVLDRVDSVTASVPLFALATGWLGLLRL